MSKFEYGPMDTYEIIWASGQVERIAAHQVIAPPSDLMAPLFSGATATRKRAGWMFHGEVDGHWKLLLFAPAEDIITIRNVTHTHDTAGGVA
ncbi:hypothetical protein [Nocardia rhizosphaerae]|uniref:Uncharacterized protein n=1 Tax=Nocardia rhizosphaerae TaxID=1691571 RepID=A0ABV8LEV6_9NOCA